MASEEDINNQSRFNDLQRDSKELLSDYQQGIRESSEFVSVLTTRSSQLVDVIKDVVKEKGKSSQADKDLISSVTKINNLAKNFATPYTNAGKAIRDTNSATELHARLLKDVRVIGNKLGADRLVQANEYLKLEEQVYKNEQELENQRKKATSSQLKASDEIIEKDRNYIESLRQRDSFNDKFIGTGQDLIDFQDRLNVKIQAEIAAKDELTNKQTAYNAVLDQQDIAQQALTDAENNLAAAEASGNTSAMAAAEAELKVKQRSFDQSKRATDQAKQMVNVSRDNVSQAQDAFNETEKGYQSRQESLKTAKEERDIARQGADAKAKEIADNQQSLDIDRDALDVSKSKLDAEQQVYLEGKKVVDNSRAGLKYLEEENKRVRDIMGAQTLWNSSLGVAEGILKKIGLDNQVITLGLDEGKKAAEEYSAELIKGRQDARGAASLAKKEEFETIEALEAAEQSLTAAKASGNSASIQAAQDEYNERLKTSDLATQNALEAEAASKKANSLVTKVGDSFRVLGKGISATFKGMASELKALGALGIALALTKKLAKAIFSAFGGKIVTKFVGDLVSKFKEGISYLKDQFFSLNSYIEDAKAGESFLQFMSQQTAEIATNLGIGTAESAKLITQAKGLSRELGMLPEELAKTTAELNIAFGTTQKFSDDTVKTMGQLTHQFGLTNDEASEFVKLSKLSGKETSDFTLETKTRIQSLKEASNIAISEKAVMQEIAKSSAAIQLSSKGQGKNLADAAFHAKKLGLSLAQTEAIGGSLLDFESSIANEMEAELLIGRDLNLDKARQFALNNDIAGVAKEIAGQIGSAAEFGKMNVLQQEALAKSVGVSKDELAEMLKTQELLAGTGFDEMSDAQEQFKKLLKETGSEEAALAKMREGGASEALTDQIRVVSLQEKRTQQERDILDAQAALAENVNAMFTAFNKVTKVVKDLKTTVVDQMKPFFDSFADLIGKGGDKFKNEVNPYAKQLGKFMNDIGLRIIDIVKNQGPALKSIFSGVLDLFGSIYSVVGGVVKQLLGINDATATSSSFFESINDTIQSMVEKLKNVDISALTEKIRGFIQGVKDTFTAVKEGIMKAVDLIQNSALGKFLSGDVGATSLAIAPLAFKGFEASGLFKRGNRKSMPMWVQDVNGGGGDMMSNLMRGGGRQAGIGGGFKKGFKGLIDYAKMAFKGGRAGKVGRARIARAAKGLVTGQGASFVGGTGRGAAQAAGSLGKIGNIGKTLGKLAKGGVVFAAAGMAAEAAIGHFQKKASKAADAMDDNIAAMDDGAEKEKAIADQRAKYAKADSLAAAGTVAKYTALGAGIGSMIPVVGTAIGAVVGFVGGVVVAAKDHEKITKWRDSSAYKAEKERLRNIKSIQRNEAKMSTLAGKMRLEAVKKAAALEISEKAKFAEQLAGVGATFESLEGMDIDHTSDAFKQLATDALNAGNITETQFTEALKGTLSPMELMKEAAEGAGNKLKGLTESALSAAEALGKKKEKEALEEAGVDTNVMDAQLDVLKGFTDRMARTSQDLLAGYSDDLSSYYNTSASEALAGTDKDAKAFRADLKARLTDTGLGAEAVEAAMANAADVFAGPGMEDVDISTSDGMSKLLEVVSQQLEYGITDPATAATAEGSKAKLKATTTVSESGAVDLVAGLTKEKLLEDEKLQKSITSLGVDLTEVLQDGITTEEFNTQIMSLTGALTTASVEDKAKFDETLKLLKANQKADLMKQAAGATAAGNTTLAEELTAQAIALDDFILRPGSAPLKFNEGDLLIGGTQLNKGLGGANENTVKLQVEPSNIDLNNYIVLPNIIDLNNYVTISNPIDLNNFIIPPNVMDLNNFIIPPSALDLNNFIILPNVVDFNTYIIYPEPLDLGNYLIPPLPIMMDSYIFPPTPIELNNFILSPNIIDINSYIQILDILLNSYIKIAEIDITPYITIDDINLNQYINKLINLNDYIEEDIDLLGKLLPIDLTQIMKMNAEETAALQSQLSEANAQLENQSLLEKGASFLSSRFRSFTGAEEVDDFILRPGEPALKFNKDDLIIGGTNLEGGENNSSEGVGELKQELQDLKQIMSGFVEQMGQVVNRPINVELNGNKVGQALGQNSYKIQ